MRDITRINGYVIRLAKAWKKLPDMRFGQLMIALEKAFKAEYGADWFYREDPEVFAFIERKVKEWTE